MFEGYGTIGGVAEMRVQGQSMAGWRSSRGTVVACQCEMPCQQSKSGIGQNKPSTFAYSMTFCSWTEEPKCGSHRVKLPWPGRLLEKQMRAEVVEPPASAVDTGQAPPPPARAAPTRAVAPTSSVPVPTRSNSVQDVVGARLCDRLGSLGGSSSNRRHQWDCLCDRGTLYSPSKPRRSTRVPLAPRLTIRMSPEALVSWLPASSRR